MKTQTITMRHGDAFLPVSYRHMVYTSGGAFLSPHLDWQVRLIPTIYGYKIDPKEVIGIRGLQDTFKVRSIQIGKHLIVFKRIYNA